jgi:hypothetical protein
MFANKLAIRQESNDRKDKAMWEKILEILAKLPVHVILFILGVALVVSGSITVATLPKVGAYQVQHPIVLIGTGVALLLAGAAGWSVALAASRTGVAGRKLDRTEYKVDFTSPADNGLASSEVLDVTGRLSKELPKDYKLWMVRRWHSDPQFFFAVQEAHIVKGRDGVHFEWSIKEGYIGGVAGEARILEMWLAGPDGDRLLNAWRNGMMQYWRLMRKTSTAWVEPWTFPGIPEETGDMELAATIVVNRV